MKDCGGAAGFLASTEVLEHVLLPLLTARDLFKLSCTSKAMRQWLLGTSPRLWQASHQAPECYTALLPNSSLSMARSCSLSAHCLLLPCRMSSPATFLLATWLPCLPQAMCWQRCSGPTEPS